MCVVCVVCSACGVLRAAAAAGVVALERHLPSSGLSLPSTSYPSAPGRAKCSVPVVPRSVARHDVCVVTIIASGKRRDYCEL